MNDYISRQIMLDAVDKLKIIPSLDGTGKPTSTEDFRVQFLGTVLKVPAAAVAPVVRCEDCRYRVDPDKCCHPDGLLRRKNDDFCSYGERKESAYEI